MVLRRVVPRRAQLRELHLNGPGLEPQRRKCLQPRVELPQRCPNRVESGERQGELRVVANFLAPPVDCELLRALEPIRSSQRVAEVV